MSTVLYWLIIYMIYKGVIGLMDGSSKDDNYYL